MIVELREGDAFWIVRLLQKLRIESPEYNYVDDNPNMVMQNLASMFDKKVMIGVGVMSTGFMIGAIGSTWYSERIEAQEQLLYVHPLFRGTSMAPRLIKEFEKLARSKGAEVLSVGASTGMAEDRTVNLYKRLGYTERSPTLNKRLI